MQKKHVKLILSVILSSCINTYASKLSITFPRNGSTVLNNNKQLTIRGTAVPIQGRFDFVLVQIDGKSIGTATLNASRTEWSITTKKPLTNGVHKIVANETEFATATSTFTLVAPAPQPKTNNSSCYSCKPCCR